MKKLLFLLVIATVLSCTQDDENKLPNPNDICSIMDDVKFKCIKYTIIIWIFFHKNQYVEHLAITLKAHV